jgi:hypothetical protein
MVFMKQIYKILVNFFLKRRATDSALYPDASLHNTATKKGALQGTIYMQFSLQTMSLYDIVCT